MCGRYDLSQTPAALRARFNVVSVPSFEPNDDVRPTNTVPVVFNQDGTRQCELMRWGLVPFWSKDAKPKYPTFNARAETVHQLASFREPFKKRRCLVPVDGFFEWPILEGEKRKCRIARQDGEPFALAGVWDVWFDKANPDSAPLMSFTILTTPANEDMAPFHDRMPAVVDPEDYDWWLDARADPPYPHLAPYRSGILRITPWP